MKIISRILFFFILLGIFSSCLKNEICGPNNIVLKAGIYNVINTNGVNDTIKTKIILDSVYAITMENNNLLKDAAQIDEIGFPLNNAANETSFVLSIEGIKDTIHFVYEKQLLFESVKCGVSYTYTITDFEFSNNHLQNVILINPKINVLSAENIKLVF